MVYSVRFCKKQERHKLIEFLRNSWKSDHIFISNPQLLDWQHLQGDRYNFVVANHDPTDKFHGVLGLISPSFYSEGEMRCGDDVWLAIWKVDKQSAKKNSIGTELLEFVKAELTPRSISAIGINREVALLYKLMGFRVGYLQQHYALNVEVDTFRIAHITGIDKRSFADPNPVRQRAATPQIIEVTESDVRELCAIPCLKNPGKDIRYVTGRYFNHPKYKYKFYLIELSGRPVSLFVARVILVGQASCVRITDFFGLDSISFSLASQFQSLLIAEGAEYIDMISSGVDSEAIRRLGFVECSIENYVPHLFEPFVPECRKVQFAVNSEGSDNQFVVFKGDSDLDRPSL